jgi:hypothetical protein
MGPSVKGSGLGIECGVVWVELDLGVVVRGRVGRGRSVTWDRFQAQIMGIECGVGVGSSWIWRSEVGVIYFEHLRHRVHKTWKKSTFIADRNSTIHIVEIHHQCTN